MNIADRQKPAPGQLYLDHISHFVADLDAAAAGFEVVGLPPEKMPEGRIQYVQQLTPEFLWRRGEVNPFRLEEVFVAARDAVKTAARWARFSGLIPCPQRDGVRLETARGSIA